MSTESKNGNAGNPSIGGGSATGASPGFGSGSAEAVFVALLDEISNWLPAGWVASLQLEDPLTHSLEEVANTDPSLETHLLAFAPLPESFTRPPDPWLLDQLQLDQSVVVPLAGERYFGRLLLVAPETAPRLDEHRAIEIRRHCRAAAPRLERQRAHLEDEKFAARLRHITEAELAERFTEACLALVPGSLAAALLIARDEVLTVVRVRLADGVMDESLIRRSMPLSGSHLGALAGNGEGVAAVLAPEQLAEHAEGQLLGDLLERLGARAVETIPLEPGGRLAGALMIVYREGHRQSSRRSATNHLARALSAALDRTRPERRQASTLLYLQELLRTAEGGLVPTLQTVVEEFVRFLGADAGVLALIDASTGNLLVAQPTGYGHKAVVPDAIPLENPEGEATSIAAHVMRTGRPYVASDTRSSPIYLPADRSIRSEIAVPLRLQGETVGVALASSHAPGFFRGEDAARFQLFADQIAVAIDNARLLDSLRQQRERQVLTRQRRAFGFHPSLQADDVEYHFGNLVGDRQGAMGTVYRAIERVAGREGDTVLIVGETGSGKEMVAHALHNTSPRRGRPLVATNFAALGGDSNLIQSELFGHEKGAFTGAVRRRKGCFEKADRSTLLIDELGDIVPAVQVKLLRVLGRSSRRELTRLGGEDVVSCDVRVLAATNKDLHAEVAEGRFREDLYYRLSSLVIRIPPLRHRPEDIPLLTRHILARLGGSDPIALGQGVFGVLREHDWPGNVRQLESVLLRALVMFGASDAITAEDVRQALALERGLTSFGGENDLLECPDPAPENWFWRRVWEPWKNRQTSPEAIRGLLARSLAETDGYYTRVAERLGVAEGDYQRFLDFLKHSGLKVDYRPYRPKRRPFQKS